MLNRRRFLLTSAAAAAALCLPAAATAGHLLEPIMVPLNGPAFIPSGEWTVTGYGDSLILVEFTAPPEKGRQIIIQQRWA